MKESGEYFCPFCPATLSSIEEMHYYKANLSELVAHAVEGAVLRGLTLTPCPQDLGLIK